MTKKQARAWQEKYGLDSTTSHKITGRPYAEDDPRFDPKTMGNRKVGKRRRYKRPLPPPRPVDTYWH